MNQIYNYNFNKEKYFFYHSLSITCFSPLTSLYQITHLYNLPNKNIVFLENSKYIYRIFPQQVLFRCCQLHASTFCKDNFSPLFAFGIIGILQGGIYGHSNLYFSKKLNITKTIKIRDYFRGPLFASSRDIISQGIPFVYCDSFNNQIFHNNKNTYYFSLFMLSISSTILSHPLHCLQIFIQNNKTLPQLNVVEYMIKKHNISLFYKGIESRIILLFLTNLFNDIFLKEIWNK